MLAADLVVARLTEPPTGVSAGSSFGVAAVIANNGTADAQESWTGYYLVGQGTSQGSWIPLKGWYSVPPLTPGQYWSVEGSPTVPLDTPPGLYDLLACADVTAVVSESDETNNCRASQGQLQVLGLEPTITVTPAPTPTATETPTPRPTVAVTPVGRSIAYQADAQHSGYVQSPTMTFPLVKKWTASFDAPVSYPVVGDGRVFVTVRNADSSYGTQLYAVDEATGTVAWGPVALGGTYYWSGLAYEGGRVFALNGSGLLRAFDAVSGSLLWSTQLPDQWLFSTPPTAFNGIVYAGGDGSGGTLYAIDEASGALRWGRAVNTMHYSSPAAAGDGVYVGDENPHVYKFDLVTGDQLWHYAAATTGGAAEVPAYYRQRLYVRGLPGNRFDAATGAPLDQFFSTTAPAFYESTVFYQTASTLEARDVDSGSLRWSFEGDGPNYDPLTSAPLVVGDHVFVGSSRGKLYALDPATGAVVWSDVAGVAIPAPDEMNLSQPLTGFGAGDGMVFIPVGDRYSYAGSGLVAYGAAPAGTW